MGLLFRWTCLKFETGTARDDSRVFFMLRDIEPLLCNSNHGNGRGIIQWPGDWGTTSIQASVQPLQNTYSFFSEQGIQSLLPPVVTTRCSDTISPQQSQGTDLYIVAGTGTCTSACRTENISW